MSPSILGDMKNRVKTDLRLPKQLVKQVEACCEALGVPKNAFFVLAAIRLAAEMGPIMPGKKRITLLIEIEKIFQKVISEARKAA